MNCSPKLPQRKEMTRLSGYGQGCWLSWTSMWQPVFKGIGLQSLLSGTIAPFTHFSLFFLLFHSLTHVPLSRPVMSLFILIFHPLPRACTHDIQPARRVSFFSFIPWTCDQSPDRHVLATWLRSYWSDCSQPIGAFVGFHVCSLLETKHGPCAVCLQYI